MLIPPNEVYIRVYNVEIVKITKMAIYSNVTALINQLSDHERCWNFSSMEVGTCFTVFLEIYNQTKYISELEEKDMKKSFQYQHN